MKIIIILFSCFITWVIPVSGFSQHWSTMGQGFDNTVRVLFSDTIANKLYIGGNFGKSDNDTLWAIAEWDGNNYHPLGCGLSWDCNTFMSNYPYPALAITRYKNEIYAGGAINYAGGNKVNGIARWNGTTWDSLQQGVKDNTGLSGGVLSLLVFNNDLYVCGMFDTAGTIPAHNIAKWDGNNWSAVGNYSYSPSGSFTLSLAEYNGKLYIGGRIQDSLGVPFNIACWDGIHWKPVGDGIKGTWSGVSSMKVFKGELYVGGEFTRADGNVGEYIQKWNDTIWSDVGGGIADHGNFSPVYCMGVHDNLLYVGGAFTQAGGIDAQNIATWDGTNWCGYGEMSSSVVDALTFFKDTLIIGGHIWYINTDSVLFNDIAKWSGGSYVDTCGNTTSINEINNKENNITVYPNPANNKITVENSTYNNDNAIISIYNIQGQLILQQSTKQQKAEINISGFARGMYYVKVETEKGIAVKKFIKE